MADPDSWKSPEILAYRAAARACYLAGVSYRKLKDILATEDELTPIDQRANPEECYGYTAYGAEPTGGTAGIPGPPGSESKRG